MMTLHAPLVGLRSFCELPWPFQFACGQAWAKGAGLTALSKGSTCRPGGGGGRDHVGVACRLFVPRLLQAWGSKLCMGVATSCATVQAGDLAGGFSV